MPPIYEYQCDACGERVEVMQKISERPLRQCPVCRKSRLRRLVSATAFRLKGSGWYETDFKKAGKKNLVAGSEEADTGKETKPKKEEARPETKESPAKPASGDKDKGAIKGKGEKAASAD